jgi:hypothetical protein
VPIAQEILAYVRQITDEYGVTGGAPGGSIPRRTHWRPES